MGDTIAPTNTTETFYVLSYISNENPKWYLDEEDCGTTRLNNAKRYDTLTAAIQAAAARPYLFENDGSKRRWGRQWGIVRVDRTTAPGTTSRVIVSKTHIDATKPCVLGWKTMKSSYFIDERGLTIPRIADARVFSDLGSALIAIDARPQNSFATCAKDVELKVFNVREETTEPVISDTLTVLA